MKKSILFVLFIANPLFLQELPNVNNIEDLPDEIREQILGGKVPLDEKDQEINSENNIKNTSVQNNIVIRDDEPFYGYNFFVNEIQENAPILDVPLFSDYVLNFNDTLEIFLTGTENRVVKTRIDFSGNAQIPSIGSVSLVGLSLSVAEKRVQALYDEKFLGITSSLSVSDPSLKKITVIGSVKNPGTFLVNPYITLSEAIKYAGGLTDQSSIRAIEVIGLDDKRNKYDLYDFLITGSRSSDINLLNGDTVLISSTSNFASISGEIHREHTYEYTAEDTISDLISFAQNFTYLADKQKIGITGIKDNKLQTITIGFDSKIQNNVIQEVYIGSKTLIDNKDIFVTGEGVSNGIYKIDQDKVLLSAFINQLSFSSNIYPYFFTVSQTINEGKSKIYDRFSLSDSGSYADFYISKNSELRFFSKDEIYDLYLEFSEESDEKKLESINQLKENLSEIKKEEIVDEFVSVIADDFRSTDFKTIFLGNISIKLPLVGNIIPRDFYQEMGFNIDLIENKVTHTGQSGLVENVWNKEISSDDIDILSFPENTEQFFYVTVSGQVQAPGRYLVNDSTSLNDLYNLAGGLKENASIEGIFVGREQIKNIEARAVENSRKIIQDYIIFSQSQSSNAVELDLTSILSLTEEIEFTGRISGDFAPDGEEALGLKLQPEDEIFIPNYLSTISIMGEVLNPVTVSFNDGYDYYDYIEMAGGFSSLGDKSNIFIIRSNGETVPLNQRYLAKQIYPQPGDTIVIPKDIDRVGLLPIVTIASQTISNIAFAAAALNSIRN